MAAAVLFQISDAVRNMAGHIGGQAEIVAGNVERQFVNVDHRDGDARLAQHGGQGATAAADHQHVFALGLAQEEVHRMDVICGADAIGVTRALVIFLLPVADLAGAIVLNDHMARRGRRPFHVWIPFPSIARAMLAGNDPFGVTSARSCLRGGPRRRILPP